MRKDLRLYVSVALGTSAIFSAINIWLSLAGDRFSVFYGILMPWITLALLILENAVVVLLIRYALPKKWVDPTRRRFAVAEKELKFYAKLQIRRWSSWIPELGQLANFRKDKIRGDTPAYFHKFLEETAYAELMHEWTFVFGALPALAYGVEGLYCTLPMCLVNLLMQIPPVMIQRYNRPKLWRVYEKKCRQIQPGEQRSESLDTGRKSGVSAH